MTGSNPTAAYPVSKSGIAFGSTGPDGETWIHLERITPEAIAVAVKNDDLDLAIAPLQNLAGITDGGVAGISFSGNDEWAAMSAEEREAEIEHWLEHEWIHLPEHQRQYLDEVASDA